MKQLLDSFVQFIRTMLVGEEVQLQPTFNPLDRSWQRPGGAGEGYRRGKKFTPSAFSKMDPVRARTAAPDPSARPALTYQE